jgi:methyl-accepting chemotaxis protein
MTDVRDNHNIDLQPDSRERSGEKGHLKHQLLWCFLTISLFTSVISIVLLVTLGDGLRLTGAVPAELGAIFSATLRWQIALSAALMIAATGGVFIFLYRQVARPLEKAAEVAERMAEGHLGETLSNHPSNEIGRIGESINSLAVNFQEMLILVWNQTDNAIARLRRTTGQVRTDRAQDLSPEMLTDLTSARQDLETMRMMVRSFDLYDVAITKNDVLTAKDTADTLN